MTSEQITILEKLVHTYGEEQINVCIEELSELIKELCKNKRGFENKESITEELADVYIMLKQMEIYYNINPLDLEQWIKFKINRTIDRKFNK